jgi:hypothetical protein
VAKWYLTFGQRYAREEHPTFPKAHPDGYVVIEADLYEDARGKAIEEVGLFWADLYSEEDFFSEDDLFGDTMFPLGEIAHFKVDPVEIFDQEDSL